MDNQHRKIAGYRELNQDEIDLMNEVKALGPVIEGVLLKISKHIDNQRGDQIETVSSEGLRLFNSTPERWAAEAKTDLQKGLMSATRAIAQPEFF